MRVKPGPSENKKKGVVSNQEMWYYRRMQRISWKAYMIAL